MDAIANTETATHINGATGNDCKYCIISSIYDFTKCLGLCQPCWLSCCFSLKSSSSLLLSHPITALFE